MTNSLKTLRNPILFFFFVGFLLFCSSCSKQAGVPKVLAIQWIENDDFKSNLDGFIDGLKVYGFEDSVNVNLQVEKFNGNKEKLSQFIKSIKKSDYDLVFTQGTQVSSIVKKNLKNIPVVFSIVTYPYKSNLVDLKTKSRAIVGTSNHVHVKKQY